MADDNDDSWLYGGGADEGSQHVEKPDDEEDVDGPVKNGNAEKVNKNFENTFDEHEFEEAGDHEHLIAEDSKDEDGGSKAEDSDDSDDDDDINVVIGAIKAGGTSYNMKNAEDKQKLPGSKFNIEEFETVGSINGQPAFEFAIENIEDKPWRKPGADITDYFNYGFNEETWRAYCERQKKMRIHESGVGLAGLTAAQNPMGSNDPRQGINVGGIKRMGGLRPKPSGMIDVIGAPSQNPIRPPAPRENVIQVMTADRREYSRTVVGNPPPNMPIQFNVPPEEFYNHEENDAFNYGYEPTQDSQWDGQNPGWAPSDIKELTGLNQPPPMMGLGIPPPMMPRMPMNIMQGGPSGIPSLMSQVTMPPNIKPGESRDRREPRHYDESRKRPRERSPSPARDRERKDRERTRDDRSKHDRDSRESRYRETSSRRETRRSKSREKSKRSKSRDKTRRSRSKDRKPDDKDKDRSSRSDKTKRSKKEES